MEYPSVLITGVKLEMYTHSMMHKALSKNLVIVKYYILSSNLSIVIAFNQRP